MEEFFNERSVKALTAGLVYRRIVRHASEHDRPIDVGADEDAIVACSNDVDSEPLCQLAASVRSEFVDWIRAHVAKKITGLIV